MKYNIQLEHLCEVDAYAHFPIAIGQSSNGLRLVYEGAEGGSIKGEKLSGTFRAIGGDWARVRPDYGFELDVRLIIDTHDGAVIYVQYGGIINMAKEQIDLFMTGVVPEGLTLYVNPKFETSDERYAWLCKSSVIGKGESLMTEKGFNVKYSWFIAK